MAETYPLVIDNLKDGLKRRVTVSYLEGEKTRETPRCLSLTPSSKLLPRRWFASTPPYQTLPDARPASSSELARIVSSPAMRQERYTKLGNVELSKASSAPVSPTSFVAEPAQYISRESLPVAVDVLAPAEKDENVVVKAPCQKVWLCSHPKTPTLPPSAIVEKPHRPMSRSASARKNAPMVIRATSTGRLATEFDQEGRVVCLSNHSHRVLPPAVGSMNGPIRHTHVLRRSQTDILGLSCSVMQETASVSPQRDSLSRSSSRQSRLSAVDVLGASITKPVKMVRRLSASWRRRNVAMDEVVA
nr:hypothetical protein L203_02732 [Cryptococcus depauperatus CBS 7841]